MGRGTGPSQDLDRATQDNTHTKKNYNLTYHQ